jgi:hypothetical protein
MTTFVPIETECSLCGTPSEQRIARVPTTEGLPDLDSRPSEQMRSSIVFWVQGCPQCGYCATDISLEYPLASQTVHSPAYQKILHRRSMPEKARQFLAWALIQEVNEEFGGAGWAAMHAAWICDDAEKPKAAVECRLLVLERFARQRARLGHITGFEEPGVEELVLADLCRRTGQYDGAARWVDQGMERHPEEIVRRGLEMEFSLAQQRDRGTHSLEELLH